MKEAQSMLEFSPARKRRYFRGLRNQEQYWERQAGPVVTAGGSDLAEKIRRAAEAVAVDGTFSAEEVALHIRAQGSDLSMTTILRFITSAMCQRHEILARTPKFVCFDRVSTDQFRFLDRRPLN